MKFIIMKNKFLNNKKNKYSNKNVVGGNTPMLVEKNMESLSLNDVVGNGLINRNKYQNKRKIKLNI